LLSHSKAKTSKIENFLQQVEEEFSNKYLQEGKPIDYTDSSHFNGFLPDLLNMLGIKSKGNRKQEISNFSRFIYILKEVSSGNREYDDETKDEILQFIDSSTHTRTYRTIRAIEDIADFLINDEDIKERIKNVAHSMLRERTKFL
ncbi:MAG: hypothetical protein ACFFD2_10620, partial [Promethearchaeota archaeon]